MCVSIGVHHELDSAFNSVLLVLTNAVKDGMHNGVNAIFAYFYYSVHHLGSDVGIVRIDRIPISEDGLPAPLDDNGINDAFNESHIWVVALRLIYYNFSCCCVLELCLRLLEHLFLFGSNSLSFSFFLLSD